MQTTSSTSSSTSTAPSHDPALNPPPPLEVEIVSEEEMAFLEAALASTRSLLSSSRALSSCSVSSSSRFFSAAPRLTASVPIRTNGVQEPDVEDFGGAPRRGALTRRLRTGALSVTDFTSAEWCEKQMELTLVYGKPEKTAAMKAGSRRHTELEEEVVQSVIISVTSKEDCWALKFLNFIFGVKQLLSVGLTRELPVVGFLEGVWVVGVIDEVRSYLRESQRIFFLEDTKTRNKATMPSEAQKRNARLQLMCYKYIWDSNVTSCFCADKFLEHFNLNPDSLLSEKVIEYGTSLDLHLETFRDALVLFREWSQMLSLSEDQMTLRYEHQTDNSLLGNHTFEFDYGLFKAQVQKCIQFLSGEREASYVAKDETFKCRFCKFASKCPGPSSPKKRPRSPEK